MIRAQFLPALSQQVGVAWCVKEPFGEVCKAGCSAMAISQTGTLTETPFCIRQLEQEKIIKSMIGE